MIYGPGEGRRHCPEREVVMVTLRWIGVREAKVRLVEGMYKGTKGRVLVGPGMSEEFGMN